MSIATIADVKSSLGRTGSTDDALLQRLLDSGTLLIERETGLLFTPNPPLASDGSDTNPPVTITLPVRQNGLRPWPTYVGAARGLRTWLREETASVLLPFAREITAVSINSPAVTLTLDAPGVTSSDVYWVENDYRLLPATYGRRLSVYTGSGPVSWVQVTGRFGITPAPSDFVDAVISYAARRYREKDAAYSDQVQLQDGSVANYYRQFPASVRAIIDSYREVGV